MKKIEAIIRKTKFEDVKEALFQQILKEKQNKNWESVQAAWRKEAKITINEELITYS